MRFKKVAAILVLSLLAGGVMADNVPDAKRSAVTHEQGAGPLERGFARIERAIARLQAKLSGRPGSESSEGCEGMMGGGMMSGGMMGGGTPNDQWRGASPK